MDEKDNLETPDIKSDNTWNYVVALVANLTVVLGLVLAYNIGYSNGQSAMYDECTAILDDYVVALEEARSAVATTVVVEDEVAEEVVEQTPVVVEEEKPAASEYIYYSPYHSDIYLGMQSLLPASVDKDKLIDVAYTYLERKGQRSYDFFNVVNVEDDFVELATNESFYFYVDLRSWTIGSNKEVLARGRNREHEYIYKYDEFNLHGDYAEYKMTIDNTCSFDVVGTHCAYDLIRAYRYNRTKDEDADIYEIRLHDFDGQYGIISGSAGDVKFYVADTNFVIQDRRVEYTSDHSYIQNWETWN